MLVVGVWTNPVTAFKMKEIHILNYQLWLCFCFMLQLEFKCYKMIKIIVFSKAAYNFISVFTQLLSNCCIQDTDINKISNTDL